MNTMKKALRKVLSVAAMVSLLYLVPLDSIAQDPGCPADCPGNPDCLPECVPIDGGLSLLIAAGIGLGAKKAYDRKKTMQKIDL
jgi:hypothetical protein